MPTKSKIEWTDVTWNPVRGCSPVSAGCDNCCAARQAVRMSGPGGAYEGLVRSTPDGPKWTGVVKMDYAQITVPFHWSKPRRVFVNSMSDLFHEDVPQVFIWHVFGVMAFNKRHTFQVLTKRPDRARKILSSPDFLDRAARAALIYRPISDLMAKRLPLIADIQKGDERLTDLLARHFCSDPAKYPLPNVWLGVSVENNSFRARIEELLRTPAAVRFVSYEPALGPLDLNRSEDDYWWDYLRGAMACEGRNEPVDTPRIDWMICDGESGPNARPCHPDWIRFVRDQFSAAGVPFLFKGWGEWSPHAGHIGSPYQYIDRFGSPAHVNDPAAVPLWRIGKREAGRIIDGRIHDEYPNV